MMKKTKVRKSRWTVPLISELYCNDMQNLIPLNTDVSTDLLRVRELVVEYVYTVLPDYTGGWTYRPLPPNLSLLLPLPPPPTPTMGELCQVHEQREYFLGGRDICMVQYI